MAVDEPKARNDADETMRLLREAQGQKTFGNYMTMSAFVGSENSLYDQSIVRLAETITEALILSGREPLQGSASVVVRKEWMGDASTVGAKIRTVMSARPEQFICFAAWMIDEERRKAEGFRLQAECARSREQKLLGLLGTATSLRGLRKTLAHLWEDESA